MAQWFITMSLFSFLFVDTLGETYYTCALNENCPPPLWKPTYNLTLSTLCQPGDSGYFVPPPDKPWGLISLDWHEASSIWKNSSNQNYSTVEATSIEGCKKIKNVSPHTRCMIYHNMELALQALESQRKVMYNPQYEDWFLQYTDGKGHKNGTIYNEIGGPGDQYFWDFRNMNAADYFITSVISTVSDPAVDGSFTDDVAGLPSEHNQAITRMNLSHNEVDQIRKATQVTNERLIFALIESGKYNWQALRGGGGDEVSAGITRNECVLFMEDGCAMINDNSTMTMRFDANNAMQSVAAFLIVRPAYAWLGFGWRSNMTEWNDVFLLDVGEPKEVCRVIQKGVYKREWSYGDVTLNCNTWQASVPHA